MKYTPLKGIMYLAVFIIYFSIYQIFHDGAGLPGVHGFMVSYTSIFITGLLAI